MNRPVRVNFVRLDSKQLDMTVEEYLQREEERHNGKPFLASKGLFLIRYQNSVMLARVEQASECGWDNCIARGTFYLFQLRENDVCIEKRAADLLFEWYSYTPADEASFMEAEELYLKIVSFHKEIKAKKKIGESLYEVQLLDMSGCVSLKEDSGKTLQEVFEKQMFFEKFGNALVEDGSRYVTYQYDRERMKFTKNSFRYKYVQGGRFIFEEKEVTNADSCNVCEGVTLEELNKLFQLGMEVKKLYLSHSLT